MLEKDGSDVPCGSKRTEKQGKFYIEFLGKSEKEKAHYETKAFNHIRI